MPTPESPTPGESPSWRSRIAPRVFIPAAVLIIAFVLYAGLLTDQALSLVKNAHELVVNSLGWYLILLVTVFVLFAIVVGAGRFGDIKLGREQDEPEFSLRTWLAMLFAAGMGIGLVFFGVAEPVSHLAEPRPGTQGATASAQADNPLWHTEEGMRNAAADAGQEALIQTFLHWGIHPWAIYVIVGLGVAYAVHRKGRPVSIRWALEAVLGRHVHGWLGDLIDIVAIVGTVVGVATSLALGALQIAGGMEIVWGVDAGTIVQVGLVVGITMVAVLSVVTGLRRGIRLLSQINVSLAALLLLFVLVAGPTLFILREFVQSIGSYLQNLLRLSFEVGVERGDAGQEWTTTWTTFYWGWWIAWAPFVGVFIARISKGRTVREFVAGALLVPSLLSFLWFSVLGGSALYQEIYGDGGVVDVVEGRPVVTEEAALFGMLDALPGGVLVSTGVLVLIALFFVTSSDSGSLVVDMLASGGDPDPPTWSRVFWAVLEGAVAASLLLLVGGGAGLRSLQTSVVLAALPVSFVMIGICIAIWRQFSDERRAMVRAERRRRARELTEQVSEHIMSEQPDGSTAPAPTQGPTSAG